MPSDAARRAGPIGRSSAASNGSSPATSSGSSSSRSRALDRHRSILAIALGIAATEAGYRTYFTTAVDLVAHLQAAHLEGSWSAKMRTYAGPSVLVIDELGYLPMDATSAHWIFQVVSRRYERGSIVLTSNRGFGDWGAVFADGVVATAILGRLLDHATVVNIRGQSYRMRAHVPSGREGAAMLG
jgi:DNA replication protein DnaC